MRSPTARTLKLLRKLGYQAAVVEKWIPKFNRRLDLWGADIIAVRPGEVLLVQTTSRPNMRVRINKCKASKEVRFWLKCGGKFAIWGWFKRKKERIWRVKKINLRSRSWTS